mgnify:CR=1 FL=1
MTESFKINPKEIDKIKKISKEEKIFRIKNLNLFNEKGFPNKKHEDWKFSDLREIVYKNFKKLNLKKANSKAKKINLIKDFDHNYVMLVNGKLISSNFKFEEKNKIEIKSFKNDNFLQKKQNNPLINLNYALSDSGYYIEVKDNYKFKKVLIIYHSFTKDLKENILNSRNKIEIGKNSELHTIDLVINDSKHKFINNVYENIFHKGKWIGIFQFAEQGAQSFAKRAKPRSIIDISAITSIYRPGPLSAGVDKSYVDAKEDPGSVKYLNQTVKDVTKETHGYLIFQEQIAMLAHKLGKNLTLDENNSIKFFNFRVYFIF